MEDLKKLIISRRGHKGHLAKLLTTADDLLSKLSTVKETNADATSVSVDVALLTENLRQISLKAQFFSELDEKIIDITEEEEKLEAAVFEAADLQSTLSEKMAVIEHTLKTLDVTSPAVATAPPQNITQSENGNQENPPIQQSNTRQVEHVSSTNNDNSLQPAADPSNTHTHSTAHTAHTPTAAHTAHAQDSTTRTETPVAHHFSARLPKLEIPIFTGEALDWQPFWDCFSAAIDTNPSLTGVQKLSYLRAQLRDEASRVIAGLPLVNPNYNHSVALLKNRYGQPQHIICAHIQALLDLPKPTNKLSSLKFFHDTIETHVRCLQSLGKSPESLDTLLAPMILSKLHEDTKRNMARGHTSAEWTVLELQAAIRNEIRIFETGQLTSTLSSQQGNPTAAFHTSHQKPHGRREASNKLNCVFCKGNHTALSCEVHKDVPSRVDIIKQQRLCFNCLAHHRMSQCSSKNRCRKCGNKHHTSICNNPKQNTSETKPQDPKPPTPGSTASDTALQPTDTGSFTTIAPRTVPKNTTCLLKTAIATVVGTDLQMEANILFDEGSQRSFLTEKLAGELALTPCKVETINLSSFGAEKPLRHMDTVAIRLGTSTGELVSITALVVPTIATPISNPLDSDVLELPHLKGLPLAHPVTAAENFEISLLIGADYYWDLVGDHIIRGAGPTAMSSKLGYLLSGPTLLP